MKTTKYIKAAVCILFTAGLMVTASNKANAQLTGLQSLYFDNQYLGNPAMAGIDKGLKVNLGYQAQWTTIPGSPKLQDGSVDFNAGDNVGLGVLVNADQTGLISRTRAMGTFAYHLPISETGKLHFGVSFGLNDTYIDYSKINGDQGDVSVSLFNQRRVYLDGDLGVAYTDGHWNLQASIPNLGSVVFNTQGTNLDVDRATFFSAASYKIDLGGSDGTSIEPKAVYRGISGFSNILDAGANFAMPSYHFNVFAMYHTNQSATAGAGFDIENVRLLFSYTNNTGPLRSYANNTFEFGLRVNIHKQ
jgi:type IX secretion system PorP/SprF family membrane protein